MTYEMRTEENKKEQLRLIEEAVEGNLYERLLPNVKEQLEIHLEKYPTSYGEALEDLTSNVFISDLKYSTYSYLTGMNLGLDFRIKVRSFYDLIENQ